MTGLGKPSPRGSRPSLQMSSAQPIFSTPNQPFEDVLLRQRTLGQDILPSSREPKRTESLYTPQKPTLNAAAGAAAPAATGGGGFFGGGKSGKLKVCLKIKFQFFQVFFFSSSFSPMSLVLTSIFLLFFPLNFYFILFYFEHSFFFVVHFVFRE